MILLLIIMRILIIIIMIKKNLTVFTISIDDEHIIDTRAAYCQQLTLLVATATVTVNVKTKRCSCNRYCKHVDTKRCVYNKRCYKAEVDFTWPSPQTKGYLLHTLCSL